MYLYNMKKNNHMVYNDLKIDINTFSRTVFLKSAIHTNN